MVASRWRELCLCNQAQRPRHGSCASGPRAFFPAVLETGNPQSRCRPQCLGTFLLRLLAAPSCCDLSPGLSCVRVCRQEASPLLFVLTRAPIPSKGPTLVTSCNPHFLPAALPTCHHTVGSSLPRCVGGTPFSPEQPDVLPRGWTCSSSLCSNVISVESLSDLLRYKQDASPSVTPLPCLFLLLVGLSFVVHAPPLT